MTLSKETCCIIIPKKLRDKLQKLKRHKTEPFYVVIEDLIKYEVIR